MSRYSPCVLAAIALTAGPSLQGQARQNLPPALSSTVGVAVDRIAYEPASRIVTVRFRNTDAIEVTAFGWSLTRLASGASPQQHFEVVDLLPMLVLRGQAAMKPVTAQLSFGPGETYSVRWVVPFAWGDFELHGFKCEVAGLVIYSDSSAAGDTNAIERAFASRREQVAADTEVLAQVRAIPRDATGGGRLIELRGREEALARARKDLRSHQRLTRLNQISSLYEKGGWAVVDEFVRMHQESSKLMSQQSYRKER